MELLVLLNSTRTIERFTVDRRKTKTKVITLANPNRRKVAQWLGQSEFKTSECKRRQARENACEQKVARIITNQSRSVVR